MAVTDGSVVTVAVAVSTDVSVGVGDGSVVAVDIDVFVGVGVEVDVLMGVRVMLAVGANPVPSVVEVARGAVVALMFSAAMVRFGSTSAYPVTKAGTRIMITLTLSSSSSHPVQRDTRGVCVCCPPISVPHNRMQVRHPLCAMRRPLVWPCSVLQPLRTVQCPSSYR